MNRNNTCAFYLLHILLFCILCEIVIAVERTASGTTMNETVLVNNNSTAAGLRQHRLLLPPRPNTHVQVTTAKCDPPTVRLWLFKVS